MKNFLLTIFILFFIGCSGASTESPQITINGKEQIKIPLGHSFQDPGAKAYDPQDGNLTREIHKEGLVDIYKEGEYFIRYTVRDSDGNYAQATRRVIVVRYPYRSSYELLKYLIPYHTLEENGITTMKYKTNANYLTLVFEKNRNFDIIYRFLNNHRDLTYYLYPNSFHIFKENHESDNYPDTPNLIWMDEEFWLAEQTCRVDKYYDIFYTKDVYDYIGENFRYPDVIKVVCSDNSTTFYANGYGQILSFKKEEVFIYNKNSLELK